MTTLIIWHNIAKDEHGHATALLAGYREGDRLVPVAAYDVEARAGAPDLLILAEDAYRLFNIGDNPAFGAPDQRAVRYRAACNRSLSVGDVVQIGAVWLSVQARGFAHLAEVPTGITLEAGPERGSRPIEMPPGWQPS